jgi:hypothetical protein
MDEILKILGTFMCICLVIFTVTCIGQSLEIWIGKAKAESVITEVPEYVAKCTKREITRNTCIEFTLYRITRN